MLDFNDKRLARPAGPGAGFQIIAPVAPVRETPDAGGRQVTQALFGEMVEIYKREGAFGLGQLRRDRYVGWLRLGDLAAPSWPSTHKVCALSTFGFSKADLKSPPLKALCFGARVAATGRRDGVWAECERAGWVHERHLAQLDRFETDPAGAAERFMEAPYLWGGRQHAGIDCTGLTQQAFEACGVMLPRDSEMQAAWAGEEISGWQAPGALRRGDLVFWEGHVGILTAPDTLLHANAFHMCVAREPLAEAIARIQDVAGEVTAVRRVSLAPGREPEWLAAQ